MLLLACLQRLALIDVHIAARLHAGEGAAMQIELHAISRATAPAIGRTGCVLALSAAPTPHLLLCDLCAGGRLQQQGDAPQIRAGRVTHRARRL
jgi:hypothetical protein